MRCFARNEKNMGEQTERTNLIEVVVRPERSMSERVQRVPYFFWIYLFVKAFFFLEKIIYL